MIPPKKIKETRYRVAVVAPTCFYYQVPIFKELAADNQIDLKVFFCSDEALSGSDVPKKFMTESDWGIDEDLLHGYDYKFMKNSSPWPSYLKPFVGLINLGIWRDIVRYKPNAVILMSWMNTTWWMAIMACLFLRIPFFYLTDQNLQRDLAASRWKVGLKKLILGKGIFRMASGFLCAGSANRDLYRFYGVPEEKLIPFAFSWGYDRLLKISDEKAMEKAELRQQFGIPEDRFVVLYCGRMSPEKSPMYLLKAFEKIRHPKKTLLFVGDGSLRGELQRYADDHGMESVRFVGFKTRREVPDYYTVSDLLVLPSDRETWGIVVNEAMCFRLPVITSDQVGAVHDMIDDGRNGFSFPQGDIDALAEKITDIITMDEEDQGAAGARSREIIVEWCEKDLSGSITSYMKGLRPDHATK